ncbi:MAG: glycoside hydrolase family 95 protein [Bacteroidetes bacterium]|nr:glycoside hydrolase family 95 protein [Bacteroidota bacterium]
MRKLLFLIAVIICICSCKRPENSTTLKVWYDKPASSEIADVKEGWRNDAEWLKALPVGNGFAGAMVFGDVNKERIQLNEKTLWSGSPSDNDNPEAYKSLGKIRELLFEGKYREATDLTNKTQVCKGAGSGNGNGAEVPFGCYQTLGDLWLDFGKAAGYDNYRRELDLDNGIVNVSYIQDGIKYNREVFASYPDRALIIRFSADKKGKLSFTGTINRPERFETVSENDHLLMKGVMSNGKGGDGMKYAVRLKAVATGGNVEYTGSSFKIQDADEAYLILTASTNYKQEYPDYTGPDPLKTSMDQLNSALSHPYQDLLKRHTDDYKAVFGKVSLKLTENYTDTIPTDVRLRNQKTNPDDLHLQQLYFQYGRYLLISSSREGSLPANLQGMWANKIQTPWNCDYHTDINVQMNYWPADVTNLAECHPPLTSLIESLVKPGKKTTAIQYKAEGWVVHPITNVWGFTAPGEHPSWGLHVGAGGWLCQHLWDHYTFTMDKEYLKRVYPVMLESARFYLKWLVVDPKTGELVSGPASSPENSFKAPDGSVAQISMGPSHDQEVIHELFTNVLSASKVLQDNSTILPDIDSALKKLALPKIGSDGRLMEWREEFPETEPTHRHVSHLYMLHPGNQIDPDKTPELAAAVRKSLEARTDIGTGWSLAWKVNFWARLKDGNRAYQLLKNVLRPVENMGINMSDAGGTYQNLFCAHPPYQIDGNFGATAGIAEMLLQSHVTEGDDFVIQILPALPDAWPAGEVKGLRARGGFEVSIKWEDKKNVSCTINSLAGRDLKVSYKGKIFTSSTEPGESFELDGEMAPITNRRHQ